MYAELKIGDAQWAVTWNEETTTPEYRVAQFAFEARRAGERGQCGYLIRK